MLDDKFFKWMHRWAFLLATFVAVVISFTGTFDHALWTPDEPRVAGIGREMLVNKDFIVPTLGDEPFLEKPPLYWWGMSILYSIFGVSDGVARLTSTLAGICMLLLVFDAGRRASDSLGGLFAAGVVASTAGFYHHFHRVIVDPWLALFIMLGYWAFAVYAFPKEGKTGERKSSRYIFLVYLAGGLAFLTKGPVGPILLAGPILIALVLNKSWDFLRSWIHVPGITIFFALCAFWPAMLYLRGGWELADGLLVNNIIGRFLPGGEGLAYGAHKNPFWFYIPACLTEPLPWTLALPAVIISLWRKRFPKEWHHDALIFWALIFPVGVLLLSIPGTKRNLYLLPLLPPLGIVVGAWLRKVVRDIGLSRFDGYILYALFFFISIVIATFLVIVPLLRRLSERYGSMFPEGIEWTMPSGWVFWGWYALLLAAGVGLIVLGVHYIKCAPQRIGLICVVMAITFFVAGGTLQYRLLDGFKNLHGMTEGLVKWDAFSPRLIGYRLDETTVALIPYDTGRTVKTIAEDPRSLKRIIEDTGAGNVLAIERHMEGLPQVVRRKLREVKRWVYSKHRIYVLFAFGEGADET